jgi:hypothetical protein
VFYRFATDALQAAGWRRPGGQPLDRGDVLALSRPLLDVLDAAGCTATLSGGERPSQAAPHAVLFARTVLAARD